MPAQGVESEVVWLSGRRDFMRGFPRGGTLQMSRGPCYRLRAALRYFSTCTFGAQGTLFKFELSIDFFLRQILRILQTLVLLTLESMQCSASADVQALLIYIRSKSPLIRTENRRAGLDRIPLDLSADYNAYGA